MENKIKYSTAAQQLEKLKKRNLTIENETEALQFLRFYGYSNLIKSYRNPYVVQKGDHKEYISSVSFDQILSLFQLDKCLRNNVMAAMQDLEEFIKELVADVLAKSFGTDPEDYLKFNHFRDRKVSNPHFSLKSILQNTRKSLTSNREPIKHYREKYGCVPPWILLKDVYFSTAVNLVRLMKPKQHSEIAERVYHCVSINTQQKRMLLNDTLSICLEYRNLCAHGGRVYNYQTRSKLRGKEIFGSSYHENKGFSQLIGLLDLMVYREPFYQLSEALEREFNRHCLQYSADTKYLSRTLNVNYQLCKV